MIKHIVSWTFVDAAEGLDKPAIVDAVVDKLSACRNLPGVLEFELARPQEGLEASFDLVLCSAFDSVESLRAYVAHPAHQAAGAYIATVKRTRQAMDYDTAALG